LGDVRRREKDGDPRMRDESASFPDFQRVFEAGPGRYLLVSRDLRIVAISDVLCRALGRGADQFVGRPMLDCFPPDPTDPENDAMRELEESLRRVIATGVQDLMTIRKYDVAGPGGETLERYWSPKNTPILDAGGRVAWVLHQSDDVTDYVRMQRSGESAGRIAEEQAALIRELNARNEALARQASANLRLEEARRQAVDAQEMSEIRFRNLADSLPGVVHRTLQKPDGSRRNVFISAGVERLLGVPASEFMAGRAFLADFMHEEDKKYRTAALARALEAGETAEIEVRMVPREGGGLRWWRLHTTPTRLDDGDVQWDGFAIDVTERKAAEQKLQQALKLDAIGQLTGGVAHDFNNLLSVILSNAEILSEELQSDARLGPLVEMTLQAAQRGAELTNGLLAFARRQPLEPRAMNVNRLLTGMDRLLRRTLGADVDLEFVQGAGLWQALVDPAQLEASVLNLALNARDAMPSGGRITIETGNAFIDTDYAAQHDEVTPGQYVMVCVTDTGAGMAPSVVARAFEPFFTTKTPGKGTGLGLAMVYGFVKQSRGHIKIYSEPGQGTAVKIYLPRVAPNEAATGEFTQPEAKLARGTETILLVEDDPLVRENAERLLRSLGYTVIVAERATVALPMIERGDAFDLLFTDVVMPGGMSGKELAERARALRPDVKILFTSGYTENAIVHQGRLDPGVNLIRKPYGRRELATRIRQVLESDS